MSAAVEQLCDRLRDWLNAIEGRLRTFKANIRDLSEKAETARCGLGRLGSLPTRGSQRRQVHLARQLHNFPVQRRPSAERG
jgi:hypothetical protein